MDVCKIPVESKANTNPSNCAISESAVDFQQRLTLYNHECDIEFSWL